MVGLILKWILLISQFQFLIIYLIISFLINYRLLNEDEYVH